MNKVQILGTGCPKCKKLAENAEAMLLLRSYSKAGRFDDLIDWSFAKAVPWWCTAPPPLIHTAPAALHEEPYDALHEAA